jgi:hypothetical protein
MMMAADGRIDCSMTEKINGVDEYYLTLNALNTPSTVSGRVTAQLEMAQPGKFSPSEGKTCGKTGMFTPKSAGCNVSGGNDQRVHRSGRDRK